MRTLQKRCVHLVAVLWVSQVLIVVTNACSVEKPISCPPYGQCCAMHEFCHETQRDCVSCFPSLYVTSESRLQFCQDYQFDSAIKMLHPSCVGACDALFGRKTFCDTAEKNILHTIAKSAPTTTTRSTTLTTAAVDGSPGTDIVAEDLTSANRNCESVDTSISLDIFLTVVLILVALIVLLFIALFVLAFCKTQIFNKRNKQNNENILPERQALIQNSQNQDHQQMCKNCKNPLNGNTGQKQQDQINSHQNGDPKMICNESNEQNNENVRQEQKERTNSREDQVQNRNQETKNENDSSSQMKGPETLVSVMNAPKQSKDNGDNASVLGYSETSFGTDDDERLSEATRGQDSYYQDQNKNQETKNENDSSFQITLVSVVRNTPKLSKDNGDNASVLGYSETSFGTDDDERLSEVSGGQDQTLTLIRQNCQE